MGRKHRFKDECPDCPEKFKSNWSIGGSSVEEQKLRHRIEEHDYQPTEEEKKMLESV